MKGVLFGRMGATIEQSAETKALSQQSASMESEEGQRCNVVIQHKQLHRVLLCSGCICSCARRSFPCIRHAPHMSHMLFSHAIAQTHHDKEISAGREFCNHRACWMVQWSTLQAIGSCQGSVQQLQGACQQAPALVQAHAVGEHRICSCCRLHWLCC